MIDIKIQIYLNNL